jgi:hypothetical protein
MMIMSLYYLSQNISKSELKKIDVVCSNFGPNIFTFVDQLLLIFWNGESILLERPNFEKSLVSQRKRIR